MKPIEYLLDAPVSSLNHTKKEGPPPFHGSAFLPAGYSWAVVPAEAKPTFLTSSLATTQPSPPNTRHPPNTTAITPPEISSSYDWVQSLVGLFQTFSAGLTLYRSRGTQTERYGYAAFGLTVVPYLLMSVFNLVAQMATADYSALYMVHSPEMDEARRHGGVFDGVVGALEVDWFDGKEGKGGEEGEMYVGKFGEGYGVEVTRFYGDGSLPPVSVTGRGTKASGVKGAVRLRLPEYTPFGLHKLPRWNFRKWSLLYLVAPIVVGCFSLLVVGALTQFKEGESTKAQRA